MIAFRDIPFNERHLRNAMVQLDMMVAGGDRRILATLLDTRDHRWSYDRRKKAWSLIVATGYASHMLRQYETLRAVRMVDLAVAGDSHDHSTLNAMIRSFPWDVDEEARAVALCRRIVGRKNFVVDGGLPSTVDERAKVISDRKDRSCRKPQNP